MTFAPAALWLAKLVKVIVRFCFVVVIALCAQLSAWAAPLVRLDVIQVAPQQYSVAAVLPKHEAFFDDVRDALRAGLQVNLVYDYTLRELDQKPWQKNLAEEMAQVRLAYDPLENQYKLILPDGRHRLWEDYTELTSYLRTVPQVLLETKRLLEAGFEYRVAVVLQVAEQGGAGLLGRLNVANIWRHKQIYGEAIYLAR